MSLLRRRFCRPRSGRGHFRVDVFQGVLPRCSLYRVRESELPKFGQLLRDFLPAGAVLDYGCGLGLFLQALLAEGFSATGVEYDSDAAEYAARSTGCPVSSLAEFTSMRNNATYDALHLGDVLEHLPDPFATLRELLKIVKPRGLLFAEGPLENNPSPVYWAARLFGAVKRRLKPNFTGSSPPTHLFRVNAPQQLAFFASVEPHLLRLHWDVQETGWPYASALT